MSKVFTLRGDFKIFYFFSLGLVFFFFFVDANYFFGFYNLLVKSS
jgi:hypothetical protein